MNQKSDLPRIAYQRVANGRQVNANLVRAAGVQAAANGAEDAVG